MQREQAIEAAKQFRELVPDTRIYLFHAVEIDDWIAAAWYLNECAFEQLVVCTRPPLSFDDRSVWDYTMYARPGAGAGSDLTVTALHRGPTAYDYADEVFTGQGAVNP